MNKQTKTLPQFTKDIEGQTVTGIFAVHGNVDSGLDMSINGSFAKRIADGSRKRAKHLWNHDSRNPPIASIRSIQEVGRDALPESVLKFAPNATGGVEVVREYYKEIPLSQWVFKGIEAGDIDEMSYAYDVHGYEFQEIDGKNVRILKDVEIFDTSDVNWGMNPATAAVKGLVSGSDMPLIAHGDYAASALVEFLDRLKDRRDFRAKEGRTLSAANRHRMQSLLKSLQDVAVDLEDLLTSTMPASGDEPKSVPVEEINSLYAQFMRTEAQLNGVA